MIPPDKLMHIQSGQRRRKLALCFGMLERDIAGIAEPGCAYTFPSLTRQEYTKKLLSLVLHDPALSAEAHADIEKQFSATPFNELRACNCARNHLLALIGTFPAEWDLIIAPHTKLQNTEGTAVAKRPFSESIYVFAEDIRSPFNIGSIFRTAEAFGAEKLFLSPFCAKPEHPRSVRSAMGCIDFLPHETLPLDALPAEIPVFALETGGTSIREFVFPQKGIVIIGSEELGVSPEALKRASYGCVSIPMKGIKASLNVGVAFGILMQKWTESLLS